MAKYMLLLRDDLTAPSCQTATNDEIFQEMINWTIKLKGEHRLGGVAPLRRENARTLVTRRDQLSTVDGPYAEGREVVVGYYIVDAASLDEAEALARQCPKLKAQGTAIEIREVGEFPVS